MPKLVNSLDKKVSFNRSIKYKVVCEFEKVMGELGVDDMNIAIEFIMTNFIEEYYATKKSGLPEKNVLNKDIKWDI